MNPFDPDLALPVLGALAAGGVIGADREYRASPAGFRTHILVSLSCTILMLAAVHQIRWLTDTPHDIIRIDPVRMAHGILTGIGFLCGGVIFREGFNVRGLTTAASLWMTASLGILFGVGFYSLAIGGTIVTLAVLAAVTAAELLVPRRSYAHLSVRFRRTSGRSSETFRMQLVAAGFKPSAISQRADHAEIAFSCTISGGREDMAETLMDHLRADDEAVGFEYLPHDS